MRLLLTQIRDLKVVLKDIERHVKNPDFLRKGREFSNFSLRPREVLANWLLCTVGNWESGNDNLTFSNDPTGGDGIVFNRKDGAAILTEHVFVPEPKDKNAASVEQLIVKAVEHKEKKGEQYAKGKDLVVFSEAVGLWYPNRATRRIAGTHHFNSVRVVHLEKSDKKEYVYCVSLLDIRNGNAPSWKVFINYDFTAWTVTRVQ